MLRFLWTALPRLGLVLGLLLVSALASAAPFFSGLGDLPGGEIGSTASAVSGDGRVVGGGSAISLQGALVEAFRWEDGLIAPLGGSAAGTASVPADLSRDGSVIVGVANREPGFLGIGEATIWDASGARPILDPFGDPLLGAASGVSADGSVIVGSEGVGPFATAFRWEAGVVSPLANPAGSLGSSAAGVSGDGTRVAGTVTTFFSSEAYLWSDAGDTPLGFLPDHVQSVATAISSNGSVIAGWSQGVDGVQAVRWTDQGILGLGDLGLGEERFSQASAVSADGSVVVGQSQVGVDAFQAFVWDEARGMRALAEVLTGLGLDLEGWTLAQATDVSDDGLTFVGTGFNPAGEAEGWIATVPEPATAALLGLGLLGLRLLRRP